MSEIKVADLQKMTGKSNSAIYKMFGGYKAHNGVHYTGLLEKCPALSYLDRSDLTEGGGTTKRARFFVWDKEIYDSRVSDGECWLSGDNNSTSRDEDHDHNDPGDYSGSLEADSPQLEAVSYQSEIEDTNLDLNNNRYNKEYFLENDDRKLITGSENITEAGYHVCDLCTASTNDPKG